MPRYAPRRPLARALALIAGGIAGLHAATVVGDPEIKTDHPYYQGELAYSTLARLTDSALSTPGRPSTGDAQKDKALKLWYWRLEHMFHQISPQEWNIPGQLPDPRNDNPLMTMFDCLSQQFSYGWGVCGTNHAMMRPILEQVGMQSRRRGINGDTTHEAMVNGKWVMVNTDSASIIWTANSVGADWASVNEIIANRDLLNYRPLDIPQYPYGSMGSDGHSSDWHGYHDAGGGFDLANAPVMYAEGYQARPIAYTLKRGETFTRFNDRDGLPNYLGAPGAYRWWGIVGNGGAFRDWSYVGTAQAPALQPPPSSRAMANSRFGNGIFEWSPTISAGDLDDGVVAKDNAIAFGTTSPKLHASSGTAKITLGFFSPYVVAAVPSNGSDPAQAGATGGAWIVPNAVGSVPVEVSVNGGATFVSAGTLSGTTKLDFTDLVKGRHAYQLRLTVGTGAGLDAFALKTCVNVAVGVFPQLKDGGSVVTYGAGSRGVVEQNPDVGDTTANAAFKVGDSGNVTFSPITTTNSWSYSSTNNQPIWVTYRLTAPGGAKLSRIDCAADAGFRIPSDPGTYVRFAVSTDGGTTFGPTFGSYSAPADNELSHGWGYGSVDVSGANTSSVVVRFECYNNGYSAHFRFLRLYGEYATPAPNALTITHGWDDSSGSGKSFVKAIAAGTTSTTYTVPTANGAVSRRVQFAIAASSEGGGTTAGGTTGGTTAGGTTAGGTTAGGTTAGGTTGGTTSGTTTGGTTGGATTGASTGGGGVGHHGCGHGGGLAIAVGVFLAIAARRARGG